MDHPRTPDHPADPRGARAYRAGPLLRLVLAAVVAVTLAACQTAEPSPGGNDGGGGSSPDLDAVAVRLQTVHAADPDAGTDGFARPLGVVSDGATDLLYVMQQGGVVSRVDDGAVLAEPFLDLESHLAEQDEVLVTDGESGLLGLVFHPDYDPANGENREVFVHYTPAPVGAPGDLRTVVSRMPVSEAGVAQPDQEEVLFSVDQPSAMHNGGQLAFGPDGMLYVALGEGNTDVTPSLSRDPSNPHGSILRLDPDADEDAYVAAGNPFAGDAAAGDPYVWHYGLRNPWRFSFDAETGDLWIADVGEDAFEEINLVPAGTEGGLDFGWDAMEGTECLDPATGCEGFETPLYVYPHPDTGDEGRSITGGYVYRGEVLDDLVGAYVFADFITGEVWALATADGGEPEVRRLLDTEHMISSLGVDGDGELLVVDYAGGVYRIVPGTSE